MIIYGIKVIDLKTINISFDCSQCGHDQQTIHIYRNFFSLFYIPVLPLNKNAILGCPNCGNLQKKNDFLKYLSSIGKDVTKITALLKSVINDAKTPLYTYMTACIIFIFVCGFFLLGSHASQVHKDFTAAYIKNPKENVLIILKGDDELFPYHIAYVSQVRNQEVMILEWKYVYESSSGARSDLRKVRNSISSNTLEKYFSEPILVSFDALLNLNVVDVEVLEKKTSVEKLHI